jgi:Leucine-rich repeat (LRR) protein
MPPFFGRFDPFRDRRCKKRAAMRSLIPIGLKVAIFAGAAFASEANMSSAQPPINGPKRPSADAMREWENHGADFGWISISNNGDLQWQRRTDAPMVNALPAFRFRVFDTAKVRALASPGNPFGLWLDRLQVADVELKDLECVRELQALMLAHTTDVSLREVSGLHKLRDAELHLTELTDVGLKKLAAMHNLRTLTLRWDLVTDNVLESIAGLKNLRVLNLAFTHVTDAGLKHLTGLNNLQRLDLTQTGSIFRAGVTDRGMKELTRLTQLESLYLWGTNVTDVGLKDVAALNNLKVLHLPGSISNAGMNEMSRLSALQELQFWSAVPSRVTSAGLQGLANLKQLRSLDLFFTGITDVGLQHLRELRGLQSLKLSCNDLLTENGITKELKIGNLEQLQTLYLNYIKVTDIGLKHIRQLKQLQSLEIEKSDVTDLGLKELTGLKALRKQVRIIEQPWR